MWFAGYYIVGGLPNAHKVVVAEVVATASYPGIPKKNKDYATQSRVGTHPKIPLSGGPRKTNLITSNLCGDREVVF